jgi:hypothetical protein
VLALRLRSRSIRSLGFRSGREQVSLGRGRHRRALLCNRGLRREASETHVHDGGDERPDNRGCDVKPSIAEIARRDDYRSRSVEAMKTRRNENRAGWKIGRYQER